jgi:hypothetical protein
VKRICLAAFCVTLALAQVAARPVRDRAALTPVGWADADTGAAKVQADDSDRRLVTNRRQLVALGFPADARDVYMHSSVFSNVRPAESVTQNFGFGAGSNYTTVAAKSFVGRQNTAAAPWEYSGGAVGCCENLSRTGLEASADAQIQLPPRVTIESIRYWAVDSNAVDDMAFSVIQTCEPSAAGGATTTTILATGSTSGSSGFQGGLLAGGGMAINTRDCTIKARVTFNGTTGLTFQKLRVEWRRTVSIAPAVATFADVPVPHFYFRYIEALAASGVTAGCGGGLYCPNDPVTRAQMAVFLSVALGLYAQ